MVDLAGMEEKTIEGDGFRLRPWRAEDARWLLRHANDAQVVRGLSERFPHPYRREDDPPKLPKRKRKGREAAVPNGVREVPERW